MVMRTSSGKAEEGRVVAFSHNNAVGKVRVGKRTLPFHATSFHCSYVMRWPEVGERVEVAFNSKGKLLAVHAKPKRPPRPVGLPDWNPKTIWILMDTSNSNQRSKNYLWWFETRELARHFLEDHNRESDRLEQERGYGLSSLIGPFKYQRSSGRS
jgi:hypothetical protein